MKHSNNYHSVNLIALWYVSRLYMYPDQIYCRCCSVRQVTLTWNEYSDKLNKIYHRVTDATVSAGHPEYFRSRGHWNGKVIILTKFSPQAALEVVVSTTSSAASDENFIKMAAFPFQWRGPLWFTEITDCLGLLHMYFIIVFNLFIVNNVDHAGSAICTKRLWPGILHGAEQGANILNLGQYQASCIKGHRWVKLIEYNYQSQCAVKSHRISVAINLGDNEEFVGW